MNLNERAQQWVDHDRIRKARIIGQALSGRRSGRRTRTCVRMIPLRYLRGAGESRIPVVIRAAAESTVLLQALTCRHRMRCVRLTSLTQPRVASATGCGFSSLLNPARSLLSPRAGHRCRNHGDRLAQSLGSLGLSGGTVDGCRQGVQIVLPLLGLGVHRLAADHFQNDELICVDPQRVLPARSRWPWSSVRPTWNYSAGMRRGRCTHKVLKRSQL